MRSVLTRLVFLLILLVGFSVSVSANVYCGHELDYFVGDSMRPYIVPGDSVGYHVLRASEKVFVGDVVLVPYVMSGYGRIEGKNPRWLVHRVVAAKKGYLILKGDNNSYRDSVLFRRSDVYGVVCRVSI